MFKAFNFKKTKPQFLSANICCNFEEKYDQSLYNHYDCLSRRLLLLLLLLRRLLLLLLALLWIREFLAIKIRSCAGSPERHDKLVSRFFATISSNWNQYYPVCHFKQLYKMVKQRPTDQPTDQPSNGHMRVQREASLPIININVKYHDKLDTKDDVLFKLNL